MVTQGVRASGKNQRRGVLVGAFNKGHEHSGWLSVLSEPSRSV
jgi:hypothetical protein